MFGLEASGFVFGTRSSNFSAGSNGAGNPPIGVPFLGAVTGKEAANVVSFPGTFAGNVNIDYSSQLWGTEANFVLLTGSDQDYRLTLLAGFRYVDFQENLNINQNTTVLAGGAILFNGTPVTAPNGVQISDAFGTRNQFYGGQVGVRAGRDFDLFSVDVTGKLALGDMHEVVNIGGNSSLVTPTGVTNSVPGGLFALSSNSGVQKKEVFAVVPEVALRLGVILTPRLSMFIGGNFLFLSSVVRPGDQVDRSVNVANVPTSFAFGAAGGPTRPAAVFQQTTLWEAGVNFGFKFTY